MGLAIAEPCGSRSNWLTVCAPHAVATVHIAGCVELLSFQQILPIFASCRAKNISASISSTQCRQSIGFAQNAAYTLITSVDLTQIYLASTPLALRGSARSTSRKWPFTMVSTTLQTQGPSHGSLGTCTLFRPDSRDFPLSANRDCPRNGRHGAQSGDETPNGVPALR